jgi:predicted phage terminase large subunit-like protein
MNSDLAFIKMHTEWVKSARPAQLPPPGDWSVWLFMAGRGAGKSYAMNHDAAYYAWTHPGSIIHMISPTSDDLRKVTFEGPSGLLNMIPKDCIDARKGYNRQYAELRLTNGSVFYGFSASEPDRLRGPQCHRLYGDELAAWDKPAGNAQYTYDMAAMGCRLGSDSRMCFATTPRAIPLIRTMMKKSKDSEDIIITRGTTFDNIDNLSKNFSQTILQYDGTKIGRQEIYGEVLNPEDEGVIPRKHIRMWPSNKPLPPLDYIVLSLDTAYTEHSINKRTRDVNPTACSVWGSFSRRYVNENLIDNDIMLLDSWAEFLSLPDLIRKVLKELKMSYGPNKKRVDVTVIEDKGSGISLRQTLQEYGVVCYPYNPFRDSKLTRLHSVSPLFANGRIWVPESPNRKKEFIAYSEPLIEQICAYNGPGTTDLDDFVDSTSQALQFMFMNRAVKTMSRVEKELEDNNVVSMTGYSRRNPYAA